MIAPSKLPVGWKTKGFRAKTENKQFNIMYVHWYQVLLTMMLSNYKKKLMVRHTVDIFHIKKVIKG